MKEFCYEKKWGKRHITDVSLVILGKKSYGFSK